jgi:2-polyprenyl-6-methoxyphenol hydroxylase-like FAD-dependent oxidoreductase
MDEVLVVGAGPVGLTGADGAHSRVRKGLGLDFAGDACPEQYMLGDVEVDWTLPLTSTRRPVLRA